MSKNEYYPKTEKEMDSHIISKKWENTDKNFLRTAEEVLHDNFRKRISNLTDEQKNSEEEIFLKDIQKVSEMDLAQFEDFVDRRENQLTDMALSMIGKPIHVYNGDLLRLLQKCKTLVNEQCSRETEDGHRKWNHFLDSDMYKNSLLGILADRIKQQDPFREHLRSYRYLKKNNHNLPELSDTVQNINATIKMFDFEDFQIISPNELKQLTVKN
jgi:hypothetical protein